MVTVEGTTITVKVATNIRRKRKRNNRRQRRRVSFSAFILF